MKDSNHVVAHNSLAENSHQWECLITSPLGRTLILYFTVFVVIDKYHDSCSMFNIYITLIQTVAADSTDCCCRACH